jgi:hypothetical protein
VAEKDAIHKLESHDFWSNSLQALVEDDDITQFIADHPGQAEKLLVGLNALEVTYSQVKAEAEAASEDASEDEDEDDYDEDEE